MSTGYMGLLLRVNLTKGLCTTEAVDPIKARLFVGGSGYSADILFNELEPGIDPLGPHNKIVFATSPLAENLVPGGGSIMVCFKAATGAWGESRCGGNFGPDMRRAGFDFIVIEGKSDKPVYLEVCDKQAYLRDASALVGKDVHEKTALIKAEMPSTVKRKSVMCIGQAGENLVAFAAIMYNDRAAGRNGGGAIMGSKNILAVAVGGSIKVEHADSKAFMDSIKNSTKLVRNSDVRGGFNEFGTVGDMAANDEDGDWPTKNWRSNNWGKGAALLDHFQEKNLIRPIQCYTGCPIGCGRVCKVEDGPYKTPEHEGAEYETVSAFTAFVLNEDMDAAVQCSYLCNKWGIDTISSGAAIAFAMDCYEQGILSKEDADGLDLSWGNAAVLPVLIEKIVFRQGLGDLLATGVRDAAKVIGKGAEELAIHVKGLEGAAHDPRSGKVLGVAYGTASRGMCHIHPLEGMAFDRGKMTWGMEEHGVRNPEDIHRWDEDGKGKDCAILQRGLSLPDILCTCKFMCYAGITPQIWVDMLNATTGWDMDANELVKVGERVLNLQKLFNLREGLQRKDDMLPKRVLSMPEFGQYKDEEKCVIKDYDVLLDSYYETCGWDKETGLPTPAKLKDLGLNEYWKFKA